MIGDQTWVRVGQAEARYLGLSRNVELITDEGDRVLIVQSLSLLPGVLNRCGAHAFSLAG